jgi:hypothetical protein
MAKAKAGSSVVRYDEELAKRAALYKQAEASVSMGQFIGTRGGILTYQGSPLADNTINAIVLDSILVNAYYRGLFDPAKPASPICYAFGREGKELKPHDSAKEHQHSQCKGCEWNEFGTAERGRGKACKNLRRLALIPAEPLTSEAIEKAELAFLMIPPTSVQGWAAHVNKLSEMLKLPPFGVVTTIKAVPHPKNQFMITFTAQHKLTNAVLGAVLQRADEAAKVIAFPYPDMETEAEGVRKNQARKAPAKPPAKGKGGSAPAARKF